MKLQLLNRTGKVLLFCLATLAIFTACEPEDDDFFDFRPVDFFITADDGDRIIDAGQSITYEDRSNNAVSREWTFEGGIPATSTDISPTVSYPEEGDFLTFVTTVFADGTRQRRRLEITVNPLIVANFTATPTALQRGGVVQFNNSTTGVGAIPPVLSESDSSIIYKWFVPGVTEDTIRQSNPAIRFPETGTYDVSLTVIRRATGLRDTEVKTAFIRTFDDPVTQSRTAKLSRDGSAIFLSLNESTGQVPSNLADFLTLSASNGIVVAFTDIETPAWSENVYQLNVNPAELTTGETYTLSFSDVGSITAASGSVLLPFSYEVTFLGEMQDWAQISYDLMNPNDPVMATLSNGNTFTFDPDGVTFAADGRADRTVFAPNATDYVDTYHGMNSTYTMTIVPGDGAELSDLGDVAIDMAFLGPEGTEHNFSQPITDIQFHNTAGFPAVPQAVLSADGRTLTLTATPPRNPNLRISAILEGPIAEGGFSVTHNAPQGVAVYTTASGN